MTTALEEGEGSASRPGRSLPRENPVPIVQEAGWAPGPFWTGAENLASTGIRTPDRPACSQSLYRLSYRTHSLFMGSCILRITRDKSPWLAAVSVFGLVSLIHFRFV